MSATPCCGRPSAEQCRCHTDAEAIARALGAYVGRRVSPQDAEDVTQEALLRLYRSAGRLQDEGALEGWMYRIARSAIIDHHRRTRARPGPTADGGLAEVPDPGPDEERAAEADLAACLRPLLAKVPASYREALELTDLGDASQAEAAARLGISVSGMKSRVQRGRRLLREEVGRCCRVELDVRGALRDDLGRDADAGC